MARRAPVALLFGLIGGALTSCGQGPEFAVNERIFELPSMKSAGAGCFSVELGGRGSGGTGTAGGSDGSPLAISAHVGENMVVQVTEQGRVLLERVYDEAFFRSGRLDEFSVTASTGHGRLLRYWASFDAAGRPSCADLGEPAPPLR